MNIYNRDGLVISFQDSATQLLMHEIKELRYSQKLLQQIRSLGCKNLVVLNQMHGVVGVTVESEETSSWFEHQGDFLISKIKGIALVVLTADCMPLVFFDKRQAVVAVVHAGWKGLAQNIVEKVFGTMCSQYGSKFDDIVVVVGPSARSCCYEVSELFEKKFANEQLALKSLFKRDNRWYFDNMLFLENQLQILKIPLQNIDKTYVACTICSLNFCSYRRQKDLAGRQVTVVALTK